MISTSYSTAGPSSAALSQMRQQMFAKLDANEDSGVDKAEFLSGAGVSTSDTGSSKESLATQLFNSFDSDSDGKLTQDELESGFQKLSDQMRATLIQQQEASRPQPPSPEQMLAKLDSNADGGVDEAEFIAGAPQDGRGPSESDLKEMFATFDTDSDGALTAEELDSGFKNSRPSGPPPGGGVAGGPPPGGGAGGPPPSSASSTSATEEDDEDTLLEMLQKRLEESQTSANAKKDDLASILSSFLKLQETQVSQTYSATA
ncbi:EF-hand domain-containing protein [Dongia sp.]|jgi:Ca2+-binding EF-hand superfamily protein|uniref:EF-hand domain-containing protein n=1 Tax=Dongia sp. TaxID=1977262 RepID=UPI0035B2694A